MEYGINIAVFPELLKFAPSMFSEIVISKCPSKAVMQEWITVK
jgi:hypothetical protein